MLAEAKDGKVLLHCASGNRVGAMLALRARWLQGKSADEAMAIGKASGMTGLAADVKALFDAEAFSSVAPTTPAGQ
jgi:rhodanese-related sulfurtransferase